MVENSVEACSEICTRHDLTWPESVVLVAMIIALAYVLGMFIKWYFHND